MAYEFTPSLIPFALAAGCLLVPWYLADELPDRRLYVALVLWTTPVVIWSVAVMLRLSVTTVPGERTWHNVRFIGPAFGTVGYFLFTAAYTNQDGWFERWRLGGLLVVPVLTTALVWTNPQHMLVRASVQSAEADPFAMTYTPGLWFFVHTFYSYALLLVGTAWLVQQFLEYRSHVFFRGQITGVLFGVLVVLTANALFNLGVTTVDWSPVAGALAAIIFGFAASEYRFLDVVPLARETVVENMDAGMLVTDSSGEIIDANGSAAEMLGADAAALIGTPLDEVLVTGEATTEEVLSATSDPKTVRAEGGQYYEITASPISTPSDERIGQVITFSEVTERVRRQQRLQEQKRSLERQNDRLDNFTSVVSHDLRSPLGVAKGRLELARETCDSEDLDEAADALDRMAELIEDLLTLAREGEAVDDLELVKLADVVEQCWRTVETGDATLVTETDRSVRANPTRLRQLLENLVRNAVEHGGADTTVTVGEMDDGFYVANDGPGIPGDRRDDVFDPGYSTTEEGTGLGLNIVQEIASAHGWDVRVTDSDAGGARFEVAGVTGAGRR